MPVRELPWPLPPMLARLERELPRSGHLFEPKWDGFRALARRDADGVDIRSRHGRPFSRYFPEVVEALEAELYDLGAALAAAVAERVATAA